MTPSRRVLIVDYGMGNVRSVENALRSIGCDPLVSSDPAETIHADAFVLPGVGAFGEAVRNLRARGMAEALGHEVLTRRKPLLGVCLGMQLLGESSEEGGMHEGLGWIAARVTKLPTQPDLRVPHIGWNDIHVVKTQPLFTGAGGRRTFYFAHSYVFSCPSELVAATFDYGGRNVAAFQKDNIFGTQFHPERSSEAGMALLRNFADRIGS